MLKNGKYDSKDKSVVFFFLFEENLSLWRYQTQLNLSSSRLGPNKKNDSQLIGILLLVVLLNLKFQLAKFKNNKEKAIIVFFFAV
jgi:hypothetical protein